MLSYRYELATNNSFWQKLYGRKDTYLESVIKGEALNENLSVRPAAAA